jgi:fatty-acyl-CoA synthase
MTTVEHFVALEGSKPGWLEYEQLLAANDGVFERPSIDEGDLLSINYTSGTTSRPKGVMIPHRMVAWNGYNTVACWQLREDDVSPIFTPLYHAGGLGAFLLPIFAITPGYQLLVHPSLAPSRDTLWVFSLRARLVF